jgi:anti-sigma factor RsiW
VTCREVADFLMDYLSRDLSLETAGAFEHHLSICANCRRYVAAYSASVALGKRAFSDDEAPASDAGVPDDLVQAILALRTPES